ncbi:MAG: RNA methyltransferase [Euryarchaeota archaeon]|jgi:TrmH family RNA methyltransferase|nr:RNA methyltransferase [Euryarchaeota archaeon]
MAKKNPLSYFYVVLVEPKNSGNVGAVARAMMNFDIQHLYLVNPCELDNVCYARAMHATKILDSAKTFSCFEDAIKNLDFLAATSSIESKTDKRHLRNPVLLENFSETVFDVKGKVGLVFGREDYGLFNEEIAACDIMLRIPTSESYLSLNLSHAVTIVLYSIYLKKASVPQRRRVIGSLEKQKLFEFFAQLLDDIEYQPHKKQHTKIMVKRIMGRSMPSKWEYHTLMGVLSKTLGKIKQKERK